MTSMETALFLIGVNALVFILYAYDKSSARNGGWRVPEKSLHLLTLVGGTPAAFAAQRVFRHKTRKGSFRVVFWLTVFLQVLVLAFVLFIVQNRP